MRGQTILDGIFRARAFFAVLVLALVILDVALFFLSFGPVKLGPVTVPIILTTTETIEAAVAIGGLSLAYATMVMAESAERSRRFESYPNLSLKLTSPFVTAGWDFRVGEPRLCMGTPALVIADEGNGPAFDLRPRLWWKTFDLNSVKSASQAELDQKPWEEVPLPQGLPVTIRRGDSPVTLGFAHLNQRITSDGRLVAKAVAAFVTLSYLNPDGEPGKLVKGGVKLIAGSIKRRPVMDAVDSEEWTALRPVEFPIVSP